MFYLFIFYLLVQPVLGYGKEEKGNWKRYKIFYYKPFYFLVILKHIERRENVIRMFKYTEGNLVGNVKLNCEKVLRH